MEYCGTDTLTQPVCGVGWPVVLASGPKGAVICHLTTTCKLFPVIFCYIKEKICVTLTFSPCQWPRLIYPCRNALFSPLCTAVWRCLPRARCSVSHLSTPPMVVASLSGSVPWETSSMSPVSRGRRWVLEVNSWKFLLTQGWQSEGHWKGTWKLWQL